MDFGICVASKIDDVGYIAHAENLGYSHAWVADSQMTWSDCYAVLALAAQPTRTIRSRILPARYLSGSDARGVAQCGVY